MAFKFNPITGQLDLVGDGTPSGSAGGVLSGTYPNPGFAADMATQAELDAVSAAKQPLDSDLTAIAGLDSSTSGAIASDGAGWIKKTYAQFKTALGLVKADVGLGSVDNTADTAKPVSTAQQTAIDAKVEDNITDGHTTVAPSGNAVFDALALKLASTAAAGGDLSGNYPSPAVKAVTETSGPTSLVAGTITDGQFLKRSGSTLVSAAAPVTSVFTRTGAVVAANADYAGIVASALTGATAATRYVGGTTSGAPASGTFAVGDFVLDQKGNVWVCVTAGTPGTWTNASKSRQAHGFTASGILVENFWPGAAQSGVTTTSQTVYGVLLGLRAGDGVTGMVLRNTQAAAGTVPTTVRAGIADSTGKMLAISGNLNNVSHWALGANALTFVGGPIAITADGGYYACFVVNGTYGTTAPTTLCGGTLLAPATTVFNSTAPPAFSWTGQTDLPAVNSSLTLTTGASNDYYMAFY